MGKGVGGYAEVLANVSRGSMDAWKTTLVPDKTETNIESRSLLKRAAGCYWSGEK